MAQQQQQQQQPLVSVRAKYKAGGKGAGVDGVLMMYPGSFHWSPNNPSAAQSLNVPLSTIKSQRWSKETPTAPSALLKFGLQPDAAAEGGYIFVFSSFPDRDKCKEIYASFQSRSAGEATPQAAAAAPSAVAAAAAAPSPPSPLPGRKPAASTPAEAAAVARKAPPATAAAATAAAAAAAAAEVVDLEEFQRRQALLQKDSTLRKLHEDLVMHGLLTEAEFWSTRKSLLEPEQKKTKQRTGISSAMLADVITDATTNTVTFNLTPQIIQQVFSEKPAVHRAFLDLVPNRMSEKDFWNKYFRAEFLFRNKKAAEAAAEAADDEELALFVKDDEQIMEEERREVKHADPTLNVLADDADNYMHTTGHGILRDGSKEGLSSLHLNRGSSGAKTDEEEEGGGLLIRSRRTVSRDINRHAAVVLQGRIVDESLSDAASVATALAAMRAQQSQGASVSAADMEEAKGREERLQMMTRMEDLQPEEKQLVVPLSIQDPQKYFSTSASSASSLDKIRADEDKLRGDMAQETNAAEAAAAMLESLRVLKRQQPPTAEQILPSAAAAKVLKAVQQQIRAAGQFGEGQGAAKSLLSQLPEATRAALFAHAEAVKELLRHFWATYPITSSILLKKAERHKEGIVQLYDKMEKMKTTAPGSCRHLLSQLLQPQFQALDAALAHFEEEGRRRAERMAKKAKR